MVKERMKALPRKSNRANRNAEGNPRASVRNVEKVACLKVNSNVDRMIRILSAVKISVENVMDKILVRG